MPTLSEYKDSARQHYLVYGRSKTGKTFGAGSFPRPNFLDFDAGLLTLAGGDFVKKFGWRPDIRYEQFDEKKIMKSGIVEVPDAFDAACRYFDMWMKKADEFDTWVIDTGTTLSEAALNKAVYLMGGHIRGIKSETHAQAIQHGLLVPKLQDYGAERSLVEQFVAMVKDSGKHTVFLCHEREIINDSGVRTGVTPLLTGKSAEAVSAMFDEVYNLTTKKVGAEVKRLLTTQTDGIVQAGSRLGIPTGTEWSWDAIQSAINETNSLRASAKEAK